MNSMKKKSKLMIKIYIFILKQDVKFFDSSPK